MRALFLFLILVNLLFFAYAQVAREAGGIESQIPLLQISPEKIRLLGLAGAPDEPRAEAAAPAVPRRAIAAPAPCLEWGPFAGPEVARADAAFARLELAAARVARVVSDASGYWVYVPPPKTQAEVERKVGELKALGVSDFFVVQETGQWRNAISLGIFRTDEAASVFLGALRERGVRDAVTARRDRFLKQVAFYVREPDEATVARLAELRREFPRSELKATACPPAKG
jgi:hypothetical protein